MCSTEKFFYVVSFYTLFFDENAFAMKTHTSVLQQGQILRGTFENTNPVADPGFPVGGRATVRGGTFR